MGNLEVVDIFKLCLTPAPSELGPKLGLEFGGSVLGAFSAGLQAPFRPFMVNSVSLVEPPPPPQRLQGAITHCLYI